MSIVTQAGYAVQSVDLWRVYGSGEAQVIALRGVNVAMERGRFTAIMGRSGSGKSTLMHCLAGLDTVTRGQVHLGDTPLALLNDRALTVLRRDKVGFVFQQFNLLPALTAQENILLPLTIAGRKPDPAWFDTVINAVSLRDRLGHKPAQLSGGQQQRVACARAMITQPEVIFADEPTGNLARHPGDGRIPGRSPLGIDQVVEAGEVPTPTGEAVRPRRQRPRCRTWPGGGDPAPRPLERRRAGCWFPKVTLGLIEEDRTS